MMFMIFSQPSCSRTNEDFVVEGPWLMYRDQEYFLFYSAGNYKNPTYRLMVARSSQLEGPYSKGDIPVVQTDWERYDQGLNTTWEGPGHGSVVEDLAGVWWLVYHSWTYRPVNYSTLTLTCLLLCIYVMEDTIMPLRHNKKCH